MISVCMATYNGERFIKEQLESILKQIGPNDEIIISDDGSKDKTIEIINSYNDNRIRIIKGPKLGVKKNFENAIVNSNGEYIFLADQDDIWMENKVKRVLEEFHRNDKITLVIHDAIVFNSENNKILYESFFKYRNSKKGIIKNIIKNTYIGCCMAFKKTVKEKIIEIPNNIDMHDQWIGIINEKMCGKSIFINEKLILYRRHSNNVSEMKHYPIMKMIKNRIVLIKEIINRSFK